MEAWFGLSVSWTWSTSSGRNLSSLNWWDDSKRSRGDRIFVYIRKVDIFERLNTYRFTHTLFIHIALYRRWWMNHCGERVQVVFQPCCRFDDGSLCCTEWKASSDVAQLQATNLRRCHMRSCTALLWDRGLLGGQLPHKEHSWPATLWGSSRNHKQNRPSHK